MTKKHLLICLMLSFVLVGCNYTISMVHTEGTAEDIIDNDQKADPEANFDINPEKAVG